MPSGKVFIAEKNCFMLFFRVKLIGGEQERGKQTRREAKMEHLYEALNGIENQKHFFMLRN